MHKASHLSSAALLLLAGLLRAQVPDGFSWVSIESDKAIMGIVRRALHDPSVTAIREVGVKDGYAIVMTAARESGAPTPAYDLWSVYNLPLATGKKEILVSGYGVKISDWIGRTKDELAITYYDCWECEAATIFTSLHFERGVGWRARWSGKKNDDFPHPGAVVSMSDVGEPYDDNEAEQVFAVIVDPSERFTVANWLHLHNRKTGKTQDDVNRYFVDPASGEDRVERLSGPAAITLQRRMCTPSSVLLSLSSGQDSRTCRNVLRPREPKRVGAK
jgi:hypothetical protein